MINRSWLALLTIWMLTKNNNRNDDEDWCVIINIYVFIWFHFQPRGWVPNPWLTVVCVCTDSVYSMHSTSSLCSAVTLKAFWYFNYVIVSKGETRFVHTARAHRYIYNYIYAMLFNHLYSPITEFPLSVVLHFGIRKNSTANSLNSIFEYVAVYIYIYVRLCVRTNSLLFHHFHLSTLDAMEMTDDDKKENSTKRNLFDPSQSKQASGAIQSARCKKRKK